MRDLIDERNYREKCARSIIKNYNVNYIQKPEEPPAEKADEGDKAASAAKEAVPLEEDNRWADVPSSGYGKVRDNDPVTEEQIQKILGERREALFEAVNNHMKEE